ncbi:hypothetical protein BDW59DRAFT_166467 [Aspergillus cavernicola]|uniref:Uncharacterized protein n=1 Tax=Aspergillus cavernicola TaxID=176166 RepID=A0ABR4HL31_9EURO
MRKSRERKRAELASLARVGASLINERLVTVTFAANSIVLSCSDTDETIQVHLPQPLQFHEAVHASELCGEDRANPQHTGEFSSKSGESVSAEVLSHHRLPYHQLGTGRYIKITSIIRTSRPWAINIGHRLEPILDVIEKAATSFGGSLQAIREFAACRNPKRIRQSTKSIAAKSGERIIICAAVAEHIHEIWPETTTLEAKLDLLRNFCAH